MECERPELPTGALQGWHQSRYAQNDEKVTRSQTNAKADEIHLKGMETWCGSTRGGARLTDAMCACGGPRDLCLENFCKELSLHETFVCCGVYGAEGA